MPPPLSSAAAPRSLEGRCYRIALRLCPPVFRREHGDEMSRDFDELRGEAAALGSRTLWTLRFAAAFDLTRTFGVQWLRTGLPVIALVAASVQIAIAFVLAAFAQLATLPMRARAHAAHPDAEQIGILFIAIVAILLIGMTITLNLWVTRLNRRRRWRR